MRIVKASVAVLLGAALVISAVPGLDFVSSAAETTGSTSATPSPSPSASPTASPTGTLQPSGSATPGPSSSATQGPSSSTAPTVGKPGIPKLSVKAGAGKITITIKKPKNVTSYGLRYKNGKGRWYSSIGYFQSGKSSKKIVQLVSKKGTYTVQVRGRARDGKNLIYSKWSKKKKATVKKLKKYKNPNMNYDEG